MKEKECLIAVKSKTYILGAVRSTSDTRDWKENDENLVGLPLVIDKSSKNTGVKDQGFYGSCAAMSTTSGMEILEREENGLQEVLSASFFYLSRANQESSGMSLRDVWKVATKVGTVSEKDFPYSEVSGDKSSLPEYLLKKALNFRAENYFRISTAEGIRRALHEGAVVLVVVPVYNSGETIWKKEAGETRKGAHMMLVTGINMVSKKIKIQNSWGNSWSKKGYTYMDFSEMTCAWEFGGLRNRESNVLKEYLYESTPWWKRFLIKSKEFILVNIVGRVVRNPPLCIFIGAFLVMMVVMIFLIINSSVK